MEGAAGFLQWMKRERVTRSMGASGTGTLTMRGVVVLPEK